MALAADPKGILEELHRKASQATLCGCIQEVIADRKWAPNGGDGLQFLFAFFTLQGENFFLIGSTQHRSAESVERELTPFASHSAQLSHDATLGTSGVGGNLLPIHMNSAFSMLMLAEPLGPDGNSFPEEPTAWNLVDWIYIDSMNTAIESKAADFEPANYRPKMHKPFKPQIKYKPFFMEPEFRASPLFQHLKESGYQYFYIFNSMGDGPEPSPMFKWNSELRSKKEFDVLCSQLSELYEIPIRDGKLSIVTQYGLNTPPMRVTPGTKILLHPEHSLFTFALDWKFGEKVVTEQGREVWISTCRYRHGHTPTVASATEQSPFFSSTGDIYYGKVERNGKDKMINNKNSFNLKTVNAVGIDKQNWRADIRISIIRLKSESLAKMTDQAEHGKGVYIRLENELLSEAPMYKTDTRHLPGGESQYRIVLDVLSKKAKENPDSGLNLESYKKNTSIKENKEIAQCIRLTINKAITLLKTVEPRSRLNEPAAYKEESFQKKLLHVLDDRERQNEQKKASMKGSRNGVAFEVALGDKLEEAYEEIHYGEEEITMTYSQGDTQIMTRENLRGQACDILGRAQLADGRQLHLVIQAKNTKAITPEHRDKFAAIVKEFRRKYPRDVVVPVFIQKSVKTFSNVLTNFFAQNGIFLLTSDSAESDDQAEACECICEKVEGLIASLA